MDIFQEIKSDLVYGIHIPITGHRYMVDVCQLTENNEQRNWAGRDYSKIGETGKEKGNEWA